MSRQMREELAEFGFPQEKIVFIPNGVMVKSRKEDHSRVSRGLTSLLYVGRLNAQKGVDVLLQAIRKMKGERVFLNILGEGPERRNLQNTALALGVQKHVEFHGNVSNVETYLAGSDIFVLPSRSEGMPNSLLEAMSVGLPCIASHIPGNTDLIFGKMDVSKPSQGQFHMGENGITVGVDDPEGLARAIEKLMDDKDLRARLSRQARRAIHAQFTMSSVVDQYICLYQSLGTDGHSQEPG